MISNPPPLQILVISLLRSRDRRAKVEQELRKVSFAWSFLDAVDGSALEEPPNEYKSWKVKQLQGYELTPNEIGCYLSHKQAWKRCVEADIPTLIFEDDFVLLPEFEHVIASLLNHSEVWNFVRLQGLFDVGFQETASINGVHIGKNIGDAVGAAAYLIKPDVASVLVSESNEIYEPVDHFLEHHKKHALNFLAVRPYPVDISRAKSTIDDRAERQPIKGLKKHLRSILRTIDRVISPRPWFPK